MSMLNVRLPDDLERRLAEEAARADMPRSELVRAAIDEMLERRATERRERQLEGAARVIAEDPELYQEARDMAEQFLPLESEAPDPDGEADGGPWWR
ncbi:CopG family transcriptional regulator [Thioalkalivibrio sp. ALJT]|uniref:ribbon-helix-helix domain-containing protein n=1 Tax=Thioalkalivibrio sp. ALJT TaxID=1158146 RepID=UPI000377117F|nr:CopG family transcriptional regulator [Thioalkalivibrio sp. ALJT]